MLFNSLQSQIVQNNSAYISTCHEEPITVISLHLQCPPSSAYPDLATRPRYAISITCLHLKCRRLWSLRKHSQILHFKVSYSFNLCLSQPKAILTGVILEPRKHFWVSTVENTLEQQFNNTDTFSHRSVSLITNSKCDTTQRDLNQFDIDRASAFTGGG